MPRSINGTLLQPPSGLPCGTAGPNSKHRTSRRISNEAKSRLLPQPQPKNNWLICDRLYAVQVATKLQQMIWWNNKSANSYATPSAIIPIHYHDLPSTVAIPSLTSLSDQRSRLLKSK